MTAPGRIPCINPRCRRTAPADKYGDDEEIICRTCFGSLPIELRRRHRKVASDNRRMLKLINRRISRGTLPRHVFDRLRRNMEQRFETVWSDIRRRFVAPAVPIGLEGFLQEVGLAP